LVLKDSASKWEVSGLNHEVLVALIGSGRCKWYCYF